MRAFVRVTYNVIILCILFGNVMCFEPCAVHWGIQRIRNVFIVIIIITVMIIILTMIIIIIIIIMCVYLNVFQINSKHCKVRVKALKPAANGHYFMRKPLPYCYHLLYRSTFIFLSVKSMLGLSFPVSIIHRTLIWTTGSLTCVHDHSYAYVYTQRVGHTDS